MYPSPERGFGPTLPAALPRLLLVIVLLLGGLPQQVGWHSLSKGLRSCLVLGRVLWVVLLSEDEGVGCVLIGDNELVLLRDALKVGAVGPKQNSEFCLVGG